MRFKKNNSPTTDNQSYSHSKRLLSLDIFRGVSVIAMILVDYPGTWSHRYPIFSHATWNGFTLPDFIFPFFLFIMGVAIPYSLGKKKEQGIQTNQLLKRIIRRCFTLFVLGYVINMLYHSNIFDFSTVRLLGVLQRIGIVYLICSILFLKVSNRVLIWSGSCILLLYWALLTLVPVPGFGNPDLTIFPKETIPNIAAWLDKVILGSRAWEYTQPFDPEGLLSTIPCISTTIIGILAGLWIRGRKDKLTKTAYMIVYGIIMVIGGTLWNSWFPINKSIWTSSFVLFTGGWAVILLALLYWVIDVRGFQKSISLFRYFGMNAISAFVLCGMVDALFYQIKVVDNGKTIALKDLIFNTLFSGWVDAKVGSFLYTIVFILILYFIFRLFFKKNIIIRV